MQKNRFLFAASVLPLIAASASRAIAQQAAAQPAQMEEVVVSASPIGQSTFDLAQPVSSLARSASEVSFGSA